MMPGMRGSAGSFDKRPAGSSVRVPDANQVEAQLRGRPGQMNNNQQTRRALQGDYVPSGYREGQIQQYDPKQQRLHNRLFDLVDRDSYLYKLAHGDESFFDEMEQPAWKLFGEAQSQTANRFSQLAPGAMSSQRGSGFQNQLGQEYSDFASKLASNRQNLRRQAISDLMGISESLLSHRPKEKFVSGKRQKDPSFLENLALAGVHGATSGGLSSLLGGGGYGDYQGGSLNSQGAYPMYV